AAGADLHGDLIGRAADAAGLHLDRRLDVLDRLLEHLHRVVVRLRPDHLESVIEDPLSDRLLAVLHDHVHELGHELRIVERVRKDLPLRNLSAPGHRWLSPPQLFGRLAPYLERPCLRPWTPTASRVPRITW